MIPPAAPSVIEGPYLADLLAQPDVLRAVRERLDPGVLAAPWVHDVRRGRFARVLLTGMGSSLHALYPLHRRLSDRGIASHWIEASELLHGFASYRRPDTLLLAVSQSGESAEIVALLREPAAFGHVIGLTNQPASTLGRAAGTLLQLHAGIESTVSCKTYLATLAVLELLASAWLGDDHGPHDAVARSLATLARTETAIRAYLAGWREHVSRWLPRLSGVNAIFVTGRGDSLAAAGTGGLILKESTRRPAEGMSAAAFRHGPLEMAGTDVLVLVFEGDSAVAPLHHRLIEDIHRGGGRALLLSDQPAHPETLPFPSVSPSHRPLAEILPVQMLSLALAARDGHEAGRFIRAAKITVTN